MLTFKEAINVALGKGLTIKGRSSRSEFWWVFLAVSLIGLGLLLLSEIFSFWPSLKTLYSIYEAVAAFIMFFPAARRLHDTNHSAYWLLFFFIPVLGTIILLLFWISEGTQGPNRYGLVPTPRIRMSGS